MKTVGKHLAVSLTVLLAGLFLWLAGLAPAPQAGPVQAQQACQVLKDPSEIPGATLIDFDALSEGTVIGTLYQADYGVSFEDLRTTRAIATEKTADPHSQPNVAYNEPPGGDSANIPMNILFDPARTHVGFWLGGGDGDLTGAIVSAYDANDNLLCATEVAPVPAAHSIFTGLASDTGAIARVEISYGSYQGGESIDDLMFSGDQVRPTPTRTPMPTWTPIPSPTPTQGPAPTATPVVPVFAYKPIGVLKPVFPPLQPDFAIHGIEITQGIQCFDTSKGLASCANNSLSVVNKKDTTARIYLKANNAFSNYNNVPVRLHIFANGVEYIGNATGKPTTSIDQSKTDSANIYFNVNFNSTVAVSFYAEVDPNNLYSETNESNNRFPAAGTISLNFRTRDTLKIVGQRLRYHPSGYGGTQYAGGWAVNGGAADWLEQLLPMRNNSINYTLKSGYLNWTTSLGSGDGQHALIQTLNAQWMLENLFGFWFGGPFTGADHVYGWAPSAGYSGGHADMPIYPHAGGLGVVGIGSDAPGTSTDNPGSGALIFGHELVHDYDVLHTDTADACGSNDDGSDFPYTSSSIQEFGFNPITGKIYDPSTTHDLMSYCPSGGSKQGWISPFTWNKMFNKLAPAPAFAQPYAVDNLPVNMLVQTVATDSLQVNVKVYNPDYAPPTPGELGLLYKAETGVAYLPQTGPYVVELRDSQDATLASYPFAVDFESEYDAHDGPHPTEGVLNDPPPFPPDPTTEVGVSFIVPWDPATASVVLLFEGQVLDERKLSEHAPVVQITNPSGAESWAAGSQHTLDWDGSDLDGDPLFYSVFYSHDGGSTWVLLAGELAASELLLNTDDLAGGSDVRFRVIATDGINTGFDETDEAISVPNKYPTATILSPVDKQNAEPGGLLVLQGIGVDFEDGTLADEYLYWESDVQGGLGYGPSLALNVLQPGWHTISLTVTDSYGYQDTSEVQVFIGYALYLPAVAR